MARVEVLGQVEAVGPVRLLSRRLGRPSSSVDTGHPPVTDPEAGAGELLGHVVVDRRGHQHLLGAGDQLGQLGATLDVELGEHVVEDQDRVVAVGAQQVVGRQPQRQRERPRLAVAGVAADGQPGPVIASAEAEDQVVAVRADQGDTPVELVVLRARPRPRAAPRSARPGPRRPSGSSNDGLYSASAASREAPRATVA